MILNNILQKDFIIKDVTDLAKLKTFVEDGSIKVNISEIARELGINRRTVKKYINGYTKPKTKNKTNAFTKYYDIIKVLLSNKTGKNFYYKSSLYEYLVDEYGYKGSYRNFCTLLAKYPEFNDYFKRKM